MSLQRVVIAGGGFSGTMVLANLISESQKSLRIDLFEAAVEAGRGVAYSTTQLCHLLNVRADRMGAQAGKPDGFFLWLQSEQGRAKLAALRCDARVDAGSFMPRAVYAAYVQQMLDDALVLAKQKSIEVQIHRGVVVDAAIRDEESQQLLVTIEKAGKHEQLVTDALVLATGNLPPRRFGFQTGLISGGEGYVADIWQPSSRSFYPDKVHILNDNSEIAIIGTGLTAIDAILTLQEKGYKGQITAISRHGWVPAPHAVAEPYPKWEWMANPDAVPGTAFGLLKELRKELQKAAASGFDWRAVIDSLRPVTQIVWKRLPIAERRKFLHHLFTLWNIHRHRMAPQIHAKLVELQNARRLNIVAGKIYYVGSDAQSLSVAYRRRGANNIEMLKAALVLNCTGPEYDVATSSHKLLKRLYDRDMITVSALRTGIERTISGTARGRADEAIFPIGTLLVGELLECTAVPELREQAKETALGVIRHLANLLDDGRKTQAVIGAGI